VELDRGVVNGSKVVVHRLGFRGDDLPLDGVWDFFVVNGLADVHPTSTECAHFLPDRRPRDVMLHNQRSRIDDLLRSWPTILVAAALLWGYWPSLLALERVWSEDPRYSHGYLVPLFSLYLVWSWRAKLNEAGCRPSFGGLLLIGIGIAMHLGGAATNMEWIDSASLLPMLAGLCVLARGWTSLKILWPAVAFLLFMIPLPYRVEMGLGVPLQRLATHASTLVLQTVGLPALEEGNTISLSHAKIGIVEACNGLSMLTFFFAISVGLILVVRRPWIEQALIIAGFIPIALIANVARITATSLLVDSLGHGIAGVDFHDLAGYLMMPFALVLLSVENFLIGRLFTEPAVKSGSMPDDLGVPRLTGVFGQASPP
jgi:exosortase